MKSRLLLILVLLAAFVLLVGLAAAAGVPAADGQLSQSAAPAASMPAVTVAQTGVVTNYLPLLGDSYDKTAYFYDDFLNEDSGWPVGGQAGDSWGYLNGEYQILLSGANPGWLMTPDLVLPADYRLDVDARLASPTGLYGLVFDADWSGGQSAYYQFLVDPTSQSFLLEKRAKDGNWTTLIDWHDSGRIHQGGATNHLRVDRIGDNIHLYVNGYLVGVYGDSSLYGAGRDAGVRAYSDNGQATDVRFDNFRAGVVALASPLYSDDFSSSASGWYVGQQTEARWRYRSGEYEMWLQSAGDWMAVIWPIGGGAGTYTVEVDMRHPSGDKSSYGLIFGFVDWDNFYIYFIDPNVQQYSVYRLQNGSWNTVISPRTSSRINKGSGSNRLELARNGSLLVISVNGHALHTDNDGAFVGSLPIGLLHASAANGDLTRYDNFTFWSLPAKIPSSPLLNAQAGPATGRSEPSPVTHIGSLPDEWFAE